MGMTIDKSLKILKNYYHFHWEYDCGDYGGLGSDEAEALKYAIYTMHKYQKIKEQVDIAIDKEKFAISDARLIQIREIINGNDD